jgi:hypothetical protein
MTDSNQLESVRSVFRRSKDSLIETYEAQGAGVGKEGDDYVIVVYLSSSRRRPVDPVSVEGVPVKFEVTGRFKTF